MTIWFELWVGDWSLGVSSRYFREISRCGRSCEYESTGEDFFSQVGMKIGWPRESTGVG